MTKANKDNVKNKTAVFWLHIEQEAERRAWNKAGFKDKEDLFERVHDLPIEEKIDLLCRLFEIEVATLYFRDFVKFQESLGKNLVVTEKEMLEYAEQEYRNSTFMPPSENPHTTQWPASRISTSTLELEKFYDNGNDD